MERAARRSYAPAPGVRHGMAVSAEAFGTLARPPGWKYELVGGRLWLEPDWRAQIARWDGPPPAAGPPPGLALRPPTAPDVPAMIDAADAAFRDSPDVFGYPPRDRRRSLAGPVEDLLALEPPWVQRASRLAVDESGAIAGMLLLREVADGVALHTLGVRPVWRRKGLATALLGAVLRALPDSVAVWSSWLIANRESGAWHRRVGFREVPTSQSALSWRTAVAWALHQGAATPGEWAEAEATVERLLTDEAAGRAPDPFARTAPVHRR